MPNLYYYRDTRGNEVDLIIRQRRQLKPVEIKAAMTFSPEMVGKLKYFCKKFTDSLPGTVIYAGQMETQSEATHVQNFINTSGLLEI